MTMRYTCNSCGGRGYDKPTGYMPRKAVCLECDGSGEVVDCAMCGEPCFANWIEEQPGGLCQHCQDELRGEGWDDEDLNDYKGEE